MPQILGAGDTKLWTDATVTFYMTPTDDLTGDTIRAYLTQKDGTTEEWGSGVPGTNEVEVGISDKHEDLATITDVEGLVLQWVVDDGTDEETLEQVEVEFTVPVRDQ